MTFPTLHNEPCDCPKGWCEHFLHDDSKCINRLPDASVKACGICLSMTWHSNGECLRCRALAPAHRGDAA